MAMEKLQLAMIPNNLRTFWMELGLYFKIGLEKKRGRFKRSPNMLRGRMKGLQKCVVWTRIGG